ncbi:hypothetical protein [Actinomarinicola tropica]|uniref:Uncharacterized protein n=1 Tax=Actinomarinicola tropica TaxID=2789776 RepID=A0A5Q2RLR4_9ACTN|nr:hypothetical protein [Actinomarinicola tropica]QGG96424.1 hypothetical protein GH723_15680 [Actinomarinicola tropica]
MTTTTTAAATTAPDRTRTLRAVMNLDVAACAVPGLALVELAGPVADVLGIENATPVTAAGAFLVVLAAELALLARAPARLLLRLTPWSAAGDAAWALGSAAVAAIAPLSGIGRLVVLAQGLAVAGMAVAKLRARRQALD